MYLHCLLCIQNAKWFYNWPNTYTMCQVFLRKCLYETLNSWTNAKKIRLRYWLERIEEDLFGYCLEKEARCIEGRRKPAFLVVWKSTNVVIALQGHITSSCFLFFSFLYLCVSVCMYTCLQSFPLQPLTLKKVIYSKGITVSIFHTQTRT